MTQDNENQVNTPAPFILVCGLDADGLYAGPVPAYLSPLDQTWPLPANGIAIDPPAGELPPHHVWQLSADRQGWIATPDYRRVTIYDTATGQPRPQLALGEALPETATLEVPPQPGEREVIRWDAEHRVWQRVPDRRGESYWLPDGSHHVISEIGEVLPEDALTELPPPTLEALREQRRADINAWRDQQEMSGIVFEHAGRRWDGGLRVRSRLSPVVSLLGLPEGFFWTDADNNDVPVTQTELVALNAAHEAAITAQGFSIHAHQREMKQAIEAMSREQLEAFRPSWPEAFRDR